MSDIAFLCGCVAMASVSGVLTKLGAYKLEAVETNQYNTNTKAKFDLRQIQIFANRDLGREFMYLRLC